MRVCARENKHYLRSVNRVNRAIGSMFRKRAVVYGLLKRMRASLSEIFPYSRGWLSIIYLGICTYAHYTYRIDAIDM